MKFSYKLLSFIFCIVLLFSFSIFSFGATVTPYGSITQSSSQVSLLEGYMFNDQDYDFMKDYVIVRTGEREYICYFNYDTTNKSALAYRYYATQLSNTQWIYHIQKTSFDNVNFAFNDYSCVGSLPDTLQSGTFRDYKQTIYMKYWFPLIGIGIMFFVFRIHKRSKSISL